MFENIGLESMPAGAATGCGEQQSKRTQSGSSSRSRRDREQQSKRTQSGSSSRSGRDREQQLKRTQIGGGRNRGASGRNRGAAALHTELSGAGGLLTVGERGGSS